MKGGWNRNMKIEPDLLDPSRTKDIKDGVGLNGPEYKENNNLNLNNLKKEGVNQYGDGATQFRQRNQSIIVRKCF